MKPIIKLTATQLNRVLTAQTYKQATAHVGLFLKLLCDLRLLSFGNSLYLSSLTVS